MAQSREEDVPEKAPNIGTVAGPPKFAPQCHAQCHFKGNLFLDTNFGQPPWPQFLPKKDAGRRNRQKQVFPRKPQPRAADQGLNYK